MNATAVFLEPATRLEWPELQPLADASEAGWDRWLIEVSGAGIPSRQSNLPTVRPPDFKQQLRACLSDE